MNAFDYVKQTLSEYKQGLESKHLLQITHR